MSNEKNLPYAVVCGGVNIDIGAHSFAPLRDRDSNPGRVELSLGGVGRNIAHNMRLLGVPTYLLTAVGGDSRASQVEESCKELGIDLSHALRVPDGRTSTYVFVGDSDGDMAVAVSDMEICEKLTPDYFASQKELLDGAAAVVVDANLPRKSIAYLVEHCAAPLFVDPVSTVKAEKLQGLLSHVHTLKPNRIEAELLSGVKITDNATLHQAAQALLDQGVQRVFLSLGGDGVFAAQQGETHLEPICKAEMRNATGAGDAMMASLVWSFLAGRDLAESCAAGTAAAAIAVESEETINPNMSAEAVLARAAKYISTANKNRPIGRFFFCLFSQIQQHRDVAIEASLDRGGHAGLLDGHGELSELVLGLRDDLVIRGVGVDLRRRLSHHDRMGRDRARSQTRGAIAAAAEREVDDREVDRRAHGVLIKAAALALFRRGDEKARDEDGQVLVAGKAVGHAVALDEGLEVGAVRLAVFDVLDLRLVSDERGGDVGIVDRAADRRIRDLVANAAAGLEAAGKAAAPQVRLVEVDAAAVLHDVAADGGDVSDLRGRRQRRRPHGRRWSAARSSAPFHPPSEAERAGCPSS